MPIKGSSTTVRGERNVESLTEPIDRDMETKTVGISIGGQFRFRLGTHYVAGAKKWMKETVSSEFYNGRCEIDVDWVGITENGETVTRQQTYEADAEGNIIALVRDSVQVEAQMSPLGGFP